MTSDTIRYARVRKFFARSAWGAPFGKPNAKVAFHHGQDIIHPAGAAIPSPVAGRIVRRGSSPELGYYLVIQAEKEFVGLCHCKSRRPLWFRVKVGTWIARVAGPHDFHGTAWTGPHSHFTYGPTPESVLGIGSVNPAHILDRGLDIAEGKIK
jgi:murein DD-endopeptidase MepM/ murein hydrolase activator NlpD